MKIPAKWKKLSAEKLYAKARTLETLSLRLRLLANDKHKVRQSDLYIMEVQTLQGQGPTLKVKRSAIIE